MNISENTSRASGVAEGVWQQFERVFARRERIRYLITGRIKTNTQPNVLVKNSEGKDSEAIASWVFPSLNQTKELSQ